VTILLVKTGTTVPNVAARRGDFEQWFAKGLGVAEDELHVVSVYRGEALPDARNYAGVVVTGSAAMVTDEEPWSLQTERWLRRAVEMGSYALGVCYGHQLLARAMGGAVANNPRGRQVGTTDVTLIGSATTDPLFEGLPRVVHVPVSHLQVVTRLPEAAQLLAVAPRDEHHAFAVGDRAWGVQFHPEFDADIVRGYIEARRDAIATEALDVDALIRDARDSPHGAKLLRAFAAMVTQ